MEFDAVREFTVCDVAIGAHLRVAQGVWPPSRDRRAPVRFLSYLFCTAPTGSRGSTCNWPRILHALASCPSLGVGFLAPKTPTAWPRGMRGPA